MSRRGVHLAVICEDDEHRRFAYRALLQLGYHHRELRLVPSPSARGSAAQWVVEQYPAEVALYRRKTQFQSIGLVALIDADNRSVEDRHLELSRALAARNLPPRGPHEAIAHLIPRRNVETWVAFFIGLQPDETADYKNRVKDVDYRMPARRFVEMLRSTLPRPAVLPSIERALVELRRLDERRSS